MSEFESAFRRASGYEPYDYQRQLGSRTTPPAVVEVPTGSGKTLAMLIPWLVDPVAPRRLVYALPMRTLVEQTAGVVRDALVNLGLGIPVHILMGGEPPADWATTPERRAVLIGTIDLLVSRALMRGYGESRFRWPVSFGLLHNDCRWVFDEVQLMGPARATSAQLDGLRAKLDTLLPCQSTWVSATVDAGALRTYDRPELGDVVTLSAEDRSGPLRARLEAVKLLERFDLQGTARAQRPAKIAESLLDRHRAGTRSIVMLNRVKTAQEVAARLERLGGSDGPEVVLLHSRFRPGDRQTQLDAALAPPPAPGSIVVATQVLEAGVDVSSALLATETAPFSAIVQRLGRCNRAGEHDEARVLWLDEGEPTDASAPPYHVADLVAARAALLELEGTSLSPTALERIQVAEVREETAVLRRRDLLDLFDTSPDLAGADIDVAPYIRADEERTVDVALRDLPADARTLERATPRPVRDELVSVPIGDLGKRQAWTFDHIDGVWRQRRPAPGSTALLRREDGGYDERRGWTGAAGDVPEPLPTPTIIAAESFDADPRSGGKKWIPLLSHLEDVAVAAEMITRTLGLGDRDPRSQAVRRAAALHDVGKAHPAFQEMLRSADGGCDMPEGEELWAKSAHAGGRNPRRHHRHELASTLAVRGAEVLGSTESNLVRYLIAAHHGKLRLSMRPAPGEESPDGARIDTRFALGILEGDTLPAVTTPLGELPPTTLSLVEMELGAPGGSWAELALGLLDEHGPFVLAGLEALLRVADWQASDA